MVYPMVSDMASDRVNDGSRMTTKKRKAKAVPPSRLRYESNNPTVSVRISQELKGELEDMRVTSGLSIADILKAGLDKLEPEVNQFYERGFSDGYDAGKQEFELMVTCFGCGRAHVPVAGEIMRAAVAQKMFGWTAQSCR